MSKKPNLKRTTLSKNQEEYWDLWPYVNLLLSPFGDNRSKRIYKNGRRYNKKASDND